MYSDTLVSINIINKNSADYCDILIDSVNILTNRFNTQVVIIDDWSDDESDKKLREIADVFVQKDTNRGEARNLADKICDGEVVIEQIDTDQRVKKPMASMLAWYLDNMPDFCLKSSGLILKRDMVIDIGWGGYHYAEDKVVWDYLINNNKMKSVAFDNMSHTDKGSQPNAEKEGKRAKFYKHDEGIEYPEVFHKELRDKKIEEEIKKKHKEIFSEDI